MPLAHFLESVDAVPDSPRLTLVVLAPAEEWQPGGRLAGNIARWTRERGSSPRLCPSALVWCARKPGRDLRENVDQIVEFAGRGDFGLASGDGGEGQYERLWFDEPVSAEEIAFASNVSLLTKAKAQQLRAKPAEQKQKGNETPSTTNPSPGTDTDTETETSAPLPKPSVQENQKATLRLKGTVPPEVWNRLGTRILPKLRACEDLIVGVEFSVSVDAAMAEVLRLELRQALSDLGLEERV